MTGALFVSAVWPGWRRGGWLLLLGLGFPLGLVGVIVGYILLDRVGVGLHFWSNSAAQLGLAVCFALVAWFRARRRSVVEQSFRIRDEWAQMPASARWLFVALLVWIGQRWIGIVLDVSVRPLQPWDAWYAYGLQAQNWFYQERLDVLSGGWSWFRSAEPLYAAGGTRHPPGIGLVQLWFLQSVGRYDDALMNLAWPAGLLAGCMALMGLLRIAGATLVTMLMTAWVFASLPMVNVQVNLAGYGDFWIGLFLLIALGGIWISRVTGDYAALFVSAVAVVGMLMTKQSGALWLPALALGAISAWTAPRWLGIAGVVGLVGGVLWFLFQDGPVQIAEIGRFGFDNGELVFPGVYPIWDALLWHLLVAPNWHLLWFLAPLALVPGVWWSASNAAMRLLVVTLLVGLGMLVLAFMFSGLGNAVIEGTSVNRLLLHSVPSLCFFMGLVLHRFTSPNAEICRPVPELVS